MLIKREEPFSSSAYFYDASFNPNGIAGTARTNNTRYYVPLEARVEYALAKSRLRPILGASIGFWQRITSSEYLLEYSNGDFKKVNENSSDGLFSAGIYIGAEYDISNRFAISLHGGYQIVRFLRNRSEDFFVSRDSYDKYVPVRLELTYRFNKRAAAK